MKSRLTRQRPSLLILAALLSCVLLLYVPSLSFLPAWHGSPAAPFPAIQPPPVPPPADSSSPGPDSGGSLVENMLENVEFHHKQADSSSKLDFNRLAQEGANLAAARGNIGPEGSLAGILELPVAVGVKTGNSTSRKHQYQTTPTNKETTTTSSAHDHLVGRVSPGGSGETVPSNVGVNATFMSPEERSQRNSSRDALRLETTTLKEIFRFIPTTVITPRVP